MAGGCKIYITGLPRSAEPEDLAPIFASCGGRIVDCFIMNTKGYGFVTFDNAEAASRAVELSGTNFRYAFELDISFIAYD